MPSSTTARGGAKLPSIDMRQFIVIISSLCKDLPMQRIASMFRDAYDSTAGGVTLTKFFQVAERYWLRLVCACHGGVITCWCGTM